MPRPETRERPDVGDVMMDTLHDRLGEYRDETTESVYLRPVGGGREWLVGRGYVRPATAEEAVRAKVRVENERSRNRVR